MVDSNCASDYSHHYSVAGFVFIMVGAAVLYKTRFQKTVATSLTIAEFVAVLGAGKIALYVRSILEDLCVPQTSATFL